jgi:hypothetical protein
VNKNTEKVVEIEKSIQFHSDEVSALRETQKQDIQTLQQSLKEQAEELDRKFLLLEKHDRKYNSLFYGFEEHKGENVYEIIRESCINDLELDEERVRNMYFAHGHRVPSKEAGPNPIIVKFTSHEDKEMIMSQAYKLAGKQKRILTDLPVIMKKERARIAKEAYNIRKSEAL